MSPQNGNANGNSVGGGNSNGTATPTQRADGSQIAGIMALARKVPTLEYAFQNILVSIATVISASLSLTLTALVVLPLSALRAIVQKGDSGILTLIPPEECTKRGKVVLIVGASRGIGFEVLKQYVPEPNTTVIAVSKDADSLRNAIIRLGDTPATVQMETLDIGTNSPKEISKIINEWDEKYGPISHLYAISGISNHIKDGSPWNMEVTQNMIQVNVSGITALSMAMYERMKVRKYGKICIVGSVAGLYSPANMISYASTKSFINTFSTSLRVLAAPHNIDVVTVEPGFIDTRMTKKMRKQGSTVPDIEFENAEEMSRRMKAGVEKGGVGVVSWPTRQMVVMNALQGLNPICDELGKFVSMKSGATGKKVT
ncbi:hypothetical protein H1R20_g8359, partial [Candolleomyces eurysporus]